MARSHHLLLVATLALTPAIGGALAQPASSGGPTAAASGDSGPAAIQPGARRGVGGYAARRFSQMDANGDGKIDKAEFLAAQGRRFEAMDADHDGKVTKAEFGAAMAFVRSRLGGRLPSGGEAPGDQGAVDHLFGRLDLNHDGVISRAEYDQMMSRRFERMDTQGRGYLTPDDMRPAFRGRGAAGANPGPGAGSGE